MSSEVELRRQIANLRIEDGNVLYDAQKPFNLLIDCSDHSVWRRLIHAFRNGEIEFGFTLQQIQTVFASCGLELIDT